MWLTAEVGLAVVARKTSRPVATIWDHDNSPAHARAISGSGITHDVRSEIGEQLHHALDVFGRSPLESHPKFCRGNKISGTPRHAERTGETRLMPHRDARPLARQRDRLSSRIRELAAGHDVKPKKVDEDETKALEKIPDEVASNEDTQRMPTRRATDIQQ